MDKSAGIVGLGVLGSAITQYLLEQDWKIHGYDISLKALDQLQKFKAFNPCTKKHLCADPPYYRRNGDESILSLRC